MRGVSAKIHTHDRQATRQYATNSPIWRRIRRQQLQRQPLCEDCSTSARPVPANTVDHKDGDSWNNEQSNLQSLCHSCHSSKTVQQDGGLGR